MRKNSVETTYKDGLCSSCGVCIGVCPSKSIDYTRNNMGFYKIQVDKKCSNCGICLKYCPGTQFYSDKVSEEYYSYGFSKDKELRLGSSSGGILTELLKYLIVHNICEYVMVIKNINDTGSAEVLLTNSVDTIIDNKGSKYCPTNIGTIIEKIKTIEGKVTVLGLPCQIFGLKNYFMDFKLHNKIKFYLSLFCNHVPSYNATNYLKKNLGLKNISKILYRGAGWPGYFQFYSGNNIVRTPFRKTFAAGFGKYFKNLRCYLCDDPFGDLADASFADSYFLSEEKNGDGYTFCVTRNEELAKILVSMKEGNVIEMISGPSNSDIKRAYKPLFDRKSEVTKKIKILETLRMPFPKKLSKEYEQKIGYKDILKFLLKYITMSLGRYKIIWKYLFKISNGFKLEQKKVEKIDE